MADNEQTIFETNLRAREVDDNFEYDFHLAEREQAVFTELKQQMLKLNFAQPKVTAPVPNDNVAPPLNSRAEDKIKVAEFK